MPRLQSKYYVLKYREDQKKIFDLDSTYFVHRKPIFFFKDHADLKLYIEFEKRTKIPNIRAQANTISLSRDAHYEIAEKWPDRNQGKTDDGDQGEIHYHYCNPDSDYFS
jgi:hypothetical protein